MSGPEDEPGDRPEAPWRASPPVPRPTPPTAIQHVTAICTDLARTTAFYRDTLGLALVREGPNDDDPDARHFWFGGTGAGGLLLSFMEYPGMETGRVGAGSTHHFALAAGSAADLEAWRDWLRSRDVPCTDIFDRGGLRSVYLRDPDGHILEITAPAG